MYGGVASNDPPASYYPSLHSQPTGSPLNTGTSTASPYRHSIVTGSPLTTGVSTASTYRHSILTERSRMVDPSAPPAQLF